MRSVEDNRVDAMVSRGKEYRDGRFVLNIPWNREGERPNLQSHIIESRQRGICGH